jgi:hypothetical protein
VLRRQIAGLLGTTPAVAGLLLARARAHHGRGFVPSLALFLLASVRPLALAVPHRVRRRLIMRFVAPMLDSAMGMAYMAGSDTPLRDPCSRLERP